MPNDFFLNLYSKIKKEYKFAFVVTLICSFLFHLFIFTNRIPNHDSLHSFYHNQAILSSGRFTLGPAASISSYFDLPWVIGILSMLYLSLFVILIVALFSITSKLAIVMISGVVTSFPVIGSTFSYLYTADAYILGYVLAVLSIYIIVNNRHGLFYSWLVMLIAIGIYQATLSVFLVFSIMLLVKKLIDVQDDLKNIFILVVKLLGTFVVSLGAYAVIFKVYQKSSGISDYQGLDQAGNVGFDVIKNGIYKSVGEFIDFYFRGFISEFDINLFELLNVGVFLVCIIVLIKVMVSSGIKIINKVLIIVLLLCIPFCSFIMFFISPSVEYHSLMKFSLVFIYITLIVIYNDYFEQTKKLIFSWVTVVLMLLTIGNNAIIDNIAYLNAEIKYERSYSLLNRVLTKAETLHNYGDAKRIMVVGKPKMWTRISSQIVANSIPSMTGAMGENILNSQSRIRNMYEYYLGIYLLEVGNEQATSIKATESFKQMEIWPANESVKVIDDVLVIRFD